MEKTRRELRFERLERIEAKQRSNQDAITRLYEEQLVLSQIAAATQIRADFPQAANLLVRDAGYALNPINMQLMATQISRLVRRVSYRYTGTVNLQMGAATRSLYAVKAATKYAMPPFGQSSDQWTFWSSRVEKMAIAVMQTTDEVYLDASLELDLGPSLEATFQPLAAEPFSA